MGAEALVRAADVPDRGTIRIPSVLRCGLLLVGVKMALRTRGFSWTIARVRQRVDAVAEIALADREPLRATEYMVALAGAFYPGRALCLEQSLALYYVLRGQGVGVKFRMGVQSHPFVAHAWVEYNGQPINDVPEHVKWFTPLPESIP